MTSRLPDPERKTMQVSVRMTPADHAQLTALAECFPNATIQDAIRWLTATYAARAAANSTHRGRADACALCFSSYAPIPCPANCPSRP